MKNRSLVFFCLLIFSSCEKKEASINYDSDHFAECNRELGSICSDYVGDYCLFGYKFGEDSIFTQSGVNAAGIKSDGGIISFSFWEDTVVSTHKQANVPTLRFSNLPACAKEKIRTALQTWEQHANFTIAEQPDNSPAAIKFFVADINIGGVGYPNMQSPPCSFLAGNVILTLDYTSDCEVFYRYVLHEIGHALGLGHASNKNVMGAGIRERTIDDLQPGDIKGIQAIYGKRP